MSSVTAKPVFDVRYKGSNMSMWRASCVRNKVRTKYHTSDAVMIRSASYGWQASCQLVIWQGKVVQYRGESEPKDHNDFELLKMDKLFDYGACYVAMNQ